MSPGFFCTSQSERFALNLAQLASFYSFAEASNGLRLFHIFQRTGVAGTPAA